MRISEGEPYRHRHHAFYFVITPHYKEGYGVPIATRYTFLNKYIPCSKEPAARLAFSRHWQFKLTFNVRTLSEKNNLEKTQPTNNPNKPPNSEIITD